MAGRKPDYQLSAMQGDLKGKVGAAWVNADGSISIDLNPFVVLQDGPLKLHLTLFKVEPSRQSPVGA
jgi:hypothetical protein